MQEAVDRFNQKNEGWGQDRELTNPCPNASNVVECHNCVIDKSKYSPDCACHAGPTRWERRYLPWAMAAAFAGWRMAQMLAGDYYVPDGPPERAYDIFWYLSNECMDMAD